MSHYKAQASEVDYELHTLGWKSFQDLCATIIADVFGQTFQSFLPSRDGGRDGAFTGRWENTREGGIEGSYTVQCKYSNKANKNLSVSDLTDEINKAKRIAKKGLGANYVLITNMGISGILDEKLQQIFTDIPGIGWFASYGRDWITLHIRENSRLRMLVPRIYGLGDLSQILDERALEQSKSIISSMGEDLAKFVKTEAHQLAAKALLDHGFVLLLGEPASGKSMIATTLAMGALDIWKCSTFKIINAQDFLKHWNPVEPNQFFWVDDVFGTTQYQKDTVYEWNRILPHLYAAIRKGAKVLFTSRDYIYRNAINDIKVSAFPLIQNSQVVINVQSLKLEEKERILYNHLKLGNQPKSFKTTVKPFLPKVCSSLHFLPEIARRIGTSIFTSQLVINSENVINFVEQPLGFLLDVIRSLDPHLRASLTLLFMRNGIMESPVQLSDFEIQALNRLGSGSSNVGNSLKAMKGSLVIFVAGDNNYWRFKHPTLSDAIGEIISLDTELIDIYIRGTPPDKLMKEITCGNVDIQGVKLVIPQSRYNDIMGILDTVEKRDLIMFLTYRCNREFIKEYLKANPEIFNHIMKVNSFLSIVPEVLLIVKLHNINLLPEKYRKRFVKEVKRLAVDTPDADFLDSNKIGSVIKPEEKQSILIKVEKELIPTLNDVIDEWRWNYDSPEDPEAYFRPLISALETYLKNFESNKDIVDIIKKSIERIYEEIEYLLGELPGEDYDYSDISSRSTQNYSNDDRNIFDDIDE